MYGVSPSQSRLLKLIQRNDVQSAAIWGTAALAGGIYVVQPFDWIRKTLFEKAEQEGN
ncbi:hypothetical protein DCAR_0520656 [Daucus carota subsp. sativus]|uniref:Ubiquinol-cytochrome c reductase complex 6.7 kDa protein n=1 Tax=Daucus carota subsp. sativus TaxID=79200 RepID=A0A162A3S0_DAUCS|nr:hypothetical protein DCAR_0520656 [Daucus carota subsp. sativus]